MAKSREIVNSTLRAVTAAALISTSLVAADFIRGDADQNGRVEITDPIRVLGHLFLDLSIPLDCKDAADADDNGRLDITDAIYMLRFLFTGTAAPPAPGLTCGEDPNVDGLGCEAFAPCGNGPGPSRSAVVLNEVHPHPFDEAWTLADVRAQHPEFEHQWIELRVVAPAAALGRLSLRSSSGKVYALPELPELTDPGALVLLVFDGKNTRSGNTVHAGSSSLVAPRSDAVELLDQDRNVLDRVEWGASRASRVTSGLGAGYEEPGAGTILARRPSASTPFDASSWFVAGPLKATPGAANPEPGVEILLPLDGSMIDAGDEILSWYVPPGLSRYRVQVATDPTFASPILNVAVLRPPVESSFQPGTYHWRVQGQAASGALTDWSPVARLEVVESREAYLASLLEEPPAGAGGEGGGRAAAPEPPFMARLSGVPLYEQRKDTRLLLLESNFPSNRVHAWDSAHPHLDETDPADNSNCAIASIQMMNGFFAGVTTGRPFLSQDRIGLEIHSQFRVTDDGPERDFNFGGGLNWDEYEFGLNWALNTKVDTHNTGFIHQEEFKFGFYYAPFLDELWRDLRASLEAGRPLPLMMWTWPFAPGTHGVVAYGMVDAPRLKKRLVWVHDPWHAKDRLMELGKLWVHTYFVVPALAGARQDEESLRSESDRDGDGILDFDEERRFGTRWIDPKKDKDTDGDCIEDLEEIRRSVFDKKHGWGEFATKALGLPARDSDGSARSRSQPELVLDTDGSGVPDFLEDINRNGERDSGESDPYDPNDDRLTLKGTEESRVDIRCVGKPFPGITYHDFTHSESADTTFELKAAKNDDHMGLVKGTVKVNHHGFNGFWVSDKPGDCGELGLTRTLPPQKWEEEVELRFLCVDRGSGPQLELSLTKRSGAPAKPKVHEHFCDYDAQIHYVGVSDAVIFWIMTYTGPNFPSRVQPIEGNHYEREDLFPPPGCYQGTNSHKLKFDITR